MKKASGKSNISILKDYVAGNRPFVSVGYTPPVEEKHKDGDEWTDENGTEWIQKGECRFTKKLYETRESTRQICPVCKKDIYWSSNRFDQKMFNKTGKCYDCLIEEETQMRIQGTYDTYEKIKIISNQRSFLKELEDKIKDSIKWLENRSNKIEYINEDGTLDTWTDVSRESFLEEANVDLKEINKSLILCEESISILEKQLNEIKSRKPTATIA